MSWLAPLPQRLDDQLERRRGLAATWVKKVVARERLAPIRQHPLEAALGEMWLHNPFGHIGQAVPGERRVEHLGGAVEGHLAFHAYLEFAAAFFKLPRVKAAVRGQSKIDAVVANKLLR